MERKINIIQSFMKSRRNGFFILFIFNSNYEVNTKLWNDIVQQYLSLRECNIKRYVKVVIMCVRLLFDGRLERSKL